MNNHDKECLLVAMLFVADKNNDQIETTFVVRFHSLDDAGRKMYNWYTVGQ